MIIKIIIDHLNFSKVYILKSTENHRDMTIWNSRKR